MVNGGYLSQLRARLRLGGCPGIRMLFNKVRRGFWAFLVFSSLFMIGNFTVFLINQGDGRTFAQRSVNNDSLLFVGDSVRDHDGLGAPHPEPQAVDILPPEMLIEQEVQNFEQESPDDTEITPQTNYGSHESMEVNNEQQDSPIQSLGPEPEGFQTSQSNLEQGENPPPDEGEIPQEVENLPPEGEVPPPPQNPEEILPPQPEDGIVENPPPPEENPPPPEENFPPPEENFPPPVENPPPSPEENPPPFEENPLPPPGENPPPPEENMPPFPEENPPPPPPEQNPPLPNPEENAPPPPPEENAPFPPPEENPPPPEGNPPPPEENAFPPEENPPPPEENPPPPEENPPPPGEEEPQPPPPEEAPEGENPLAKYGDPKNLDNRFHYPTADLPTFYKPPPDSPFSQKKSSWDYTNLLEVEAPPYLPNYRNPCWMEELSDPRPYTDNWMYTNFEYEDTYKEMEARWDDKLAQGQNWRMRCLPSFFVAGMAKCGTTELYDKISLHPQVVTGAMKEPHWWTRYRLGWTNDGYVPIMNYVDMYDKAAEQIFNYSEWRGEEEYHPHIFGDGSVTTLYQNDYWYDLPENAGHPEGPRHLVADYIKHLLPDSKFLVMLRNPADRLYSDYLFFEWRKKKSVEEFHSFVSDSIKKMNECLEHWSLYSCVTNATLHSISKLHLRDGMYYAYLKQYYDIWPRDRIFVTRLEDYKADRAETLIKAIEFLGLEPMPQEVLDSLNVLGVSNARQGYNLEVGQMLDETRALIDDFHKPYNEKLAELLGEERFLWNDLR